MITYYFSNLEILQASITIGYDTQCSLYNVTYFRGACYIYIQGMTLMTTVFFSSKPWCTSPQLYCIISQHTIIYMIFILHGLKAVLLLCAIWVSLWRWVMMQVTSVSNVHPDRNFRSLGKKKEDQNSITLYNSNDKITTHLSPATILVQKSNPPPPTKKERRARCKYIGCFLTKQLLLVTSDWLTQCKSSKSNFNIQWKMWF